MTVHSADEKLLRRQMINLLVDDWIKVGDHVDSLRRLLILGQPALQDVHTDELKVAVWDDAYQHTFSGTAEAESGEDFEKWILSQKVEDHFAKV